ncbi:cytochrome P450 [Nonomuraea sp. NPDC050786]|uniref:cytochrome P450 n=1 Tax=Nonomuraea sp. NPDC050786 TaxID=3154840 RepID=UPI0033DAAED1
MIPPGPRLPSVVQTAWFMRDAPGMLESFQRKYGPIFTVRYTGFAPEVYVTTGELAEQVYRTDQGGGRAGEARRDFLEHMVGAHSVLTLDGDPWWRHRKLLNPPLRAKQVAGYRDDIAAIAAEKIATWPLDRPFALRERMQDITLEIIIRLIFGIQDTGRIGRLRALLPDLIETGGSMPVVMLPDRFRGLPYWPHARFARLRAEVDAILFDEIRRRRAAPGGADVLGRLLDTDLGDQEIRDELITMLVAGHETTATGLAWAFERLLRMPEVLERLPDDEAYLDAVVKEVLRVRPVVYEAPRLLDAPLELGGYEIPAGWYAGPYIPLVHRDPAAFPEPDEFRPERFLDGPQNRAQNRAWMPFGGGRRFCVGAQLALLEMRVIIREVLHRLELTAPDQAPEARRLKNVTLAPAKLTRVTARARTPARTS